MVTMTDQVNIDGVLYIRADSVNMPAALKDGFEYVIVRSGQAGVFAGYLAEHVGDTVHLLESRRIYYWAGAATLSQLAIDGTSKPDTCKFPAPLPEHTILGVCEIIPCSAKARLSIAGVKVWAE